MPCPREPVLVTWPMQQVFHRLPATINWSMGHARAGSLWVLGMAFGGPANDPRNVHPFTYNHLIGSKGTGLIYRGNWSLSRASHLEIPPVELLLLLINNSLSSPYKDILYMQYTVLKIRPATKAYNGPNTIINILINIIKRHSSYTLYDILSSQA